MNNNSNLDNNRQEARTRDRNSLKTRKDQENNQQNHKKSLKMSWLNTIKALVKDSNLRLIRQEASKN